MYKRQARLAEALVAQGYTVQAPQTNMVFLTVDDPAALVAAAKAQGVLFSGAGPDRVRLVTHLDVSDDDITRAVEILGALRG